MLNLDIDKYNGISPAPAAKPVAAAAPAQPASNKGDDKDWSFGDFLDFINPLQHIPLVNYAYRAMTGDETPKAAVQVAGGALFGGVIGAVASLVTAGIEGAAGDSIPDMAMNLFNSDEAATPPATALAANSNTPVPAASMAAPAPAPNTQIVDAAATTQPSAFIQNLQKGITGAKTYPASFNVPQRNPLHDQMTQVRQANNIPPDSAATQNDFAQKMLDAMDRYQKMQQTAGGAATPAAPKIDASL